MSEPNYGQNGWERWRGDVTATLEALERGQARIERALEDKDSRTSDRFSKLDQNISGAYRRIEAVEQRWTWAALSALAALVMALAAWIAKFVRLTQ